MLTKITAAAAACSLAALAPLCGVQGAGLNFTGTATAAASVRPDASCNPFSNFRGTVLPGNSSGMSNLGAFTYLHSICTQGAITPISLQNGTFGINFANGAISGTVTGTSTPSTTAGVFNQLFDFVITGGTGDFLGASGTFANIGTVDIRTAPPSRLHFNFAGAINAPAIPEPASWALLILGFGAVGAAMRGRGRQARFAFA